MQKIFRMATLLLPGMFSSVAVFGQSKYDLNGDGSVNVGDVTELVGVVLGGGGGSALGGAQTIKVGSVEFKMLPVSGGTFQMGSPESDTDADDDERPQHSVTLSDFYMGETEVTQALWLEVMGSNPSEFTGDLQRPVEMVSWDDCQEFITKLNEKTGKTFRLPTEAEWEYAARGGSKSRGYKYAGSNDLDKVGWYEDNSSETTHPVKQKQANELGLYDMTGNVWEWCADRFGDYGSSAQTNPAGASTGSYRVYRGGSWYSNARYCRVATRYWPEPSKRYGNLGLRLVMEK